MMEVKLCTLAKLMNWWIDEIKSDETISNWWNDEMMKLKLMKLFQIDEMMKWWNLAFWTVLENWWNDGG